MRLEYELTLQDYIDADRAILEYNFSQPWVSWGLIPVLAVFFILSGLYLIWQGIILSDNSDKIITILDGFVSFGFGILFAIVFNPKVVHKIARRIKSQAFERNYKVVLNRGKQRILTLTPSEFTLQSEKFQLVRKWCVFSRWLEGETVLIFYHSKFMPFPSGSKYLFFPKRAFISTEQLQEFKTILQQNFKLAK